MFIDFFYYLRSRGLEVSLKEWLVLLEAMEKGLHGNTLTGFYRLCRAIILKDETEYDQFDIAFSEYFRRTFDAAGKDESIREYEDSLRSLFSREADDAVPENGAAAEAEPDAAAGQGEGLAGVPGAHSSVGASGGRSAIIEAGSRTYRDFRKDNVLDTRQFQMAFRLLRNLSEQSDSSELEFDIDKTIHETARRGGLLDIHYKKPRLNTIKVILLMDSGGSMSPHARLCSHLFQAAVASRHFKELKIYYFHNCIYSALYDDPTLLMEGGITLKRLFNNCDERYRVIFVGDAEMHPYEFRATSFNWIDNEMSDPGDVCLRKMKKHFPHSIWLNPLRMPDSLDDYTETHLEIASIINMFDLTLDGLEKGMKFLLSGK